MTKKYKKSSNSSILQAVIPIKALLGRMSIVFFILAAIAIIALGKINPDLVSKTRTKLADITLPVLSALSSPAQSYQSIKDGLHNIVFVYQENHQLRQQNASLARLKEVTVALEAENRRLRELLSYLPEPGVEFMTARVVGDTGGSYNRSALINAGAAYGVKDGQVVTNKEGLVGRVVETGDNSARILLITDLNSRIPIITQYSRERAILAGTNSNMPKLVHFPRDSKIKPGERIVTSGDGVLFPPEVPVGVVHSVTNKSIYIKPFVDWGRLEYVTITEYQPAPSPEKSAANENPTSNGGRY